jgi:hypothetical protein
MKASADISSDCQRPFIGRWVDSPSTHFGLRLFERSISPSRSACHFRLGFVDNFLDSVPTEISLIESMAEVRPAGHGAGV